MNEKKERLNMKMIKRSLVMLCFLISSIPIMAQEVERQIIASAGNTNSNSSFTIGEVIVSTNNLEVIAGFQQPEFMVDPVTSITDITNELRVFPVPTKNILTIQGRDFESQTTQAMLYTLEGKQAEISIEQFQNEMKLDLGDLPSGNYFLTLTNKTNLTMARYKILKIK